MKVFLIAFFALFGLVLSAPAVAAAQTGAGRPVLTAQPKPAAPGDSPAPANPALVLNGASPATDPDYRIGPDDSLQITVWKEPTLSGAFLVRPDGMISLVLLGDVRAAGLTPMQLASDLTERLKKFLQDPLVAVTVVAANSQRIYVLGEVQRVGPIEMSTSMSPLQAIAAAGGLTPYASQKKIYILRGPAGRQKKIPFNYKSALKGNPSSSVTLMAGDTIVVP
jgi:polysaccharide export outer membrane protein